MRRKLTVILAALATALGATAALAPVAPAGAGGVATPAVLAQPADSLVDSYGVGVHLNYLDTPYRNTEAVIAALRTLGVRHVRDDLSLDSPRQLAAIRKAASLGIRFDLITGRPTSPDSPQRYVTTIATQLPGAVESIEGTNEWDLSGRSGWVAELRQRQAALYAAAKADPLIAAIPVLAPALAFVSNAAALGSVASTSDESNAHFYAGGLVPDAPFAAGIPAVRSLAGSAAPLVVTEAGYHDAMNATSSHLPTPADVTAAYLPRLLLSSYVRGVKRVYSYELLDEFADPGLTDPEAHFGLLHHDLTPKPAYTAMRTVLGLAADPGRSFAPGRLAYSVTGGGSDLHQLLLQKRTGRFVLFLWRDVSLWDPVTRRRTPAPARTVSLHLARRAALTVVRPTSGPRPVMSADAKSISLPLAGQAMAVTIAPTGSSATTGRAPRRPRIVRVRPHGAGALAVVWRAGRGGAPVTAYRVRAGARTIQVPASRLRTVVTGLRRHHALRVGVAAGGDAGWSAFTWSQRERVR